MSVPTYDQFIEPILRHLAKHPGEVPIAQVHEAAAQALGLTEADLAQRLPSGTQPVYKNRAGWAHDRLKRAGLSSSPRRGYWQLTEAGQRYVAAHPTRLSTADVEQLALGHIDVRLRPRASGSQLTDPPAAVMRTAVAATTSPDERLAEAIDELRQSVADELLDTVRRASPSFFESLVLDLLHRMGYGASRADLHRVGGSGDAGIDGVISLDKLGLEKVYVQAKRWQGAVGRPEVQAFYGALAGQRASKGVFITTSAYTQQAVDFAHSVQGIVLVDGLRLVELMIDHEVGVSSRTLKLPRLDSDYFDEAVV